MCITQQQSSYHIYNNLISLYSKPTREPFYHINPMTQYGRSLKQHTCYSNTLTVLISNNKIYALGPASSSQRLNGLGVWFSISRLSHLLVRQTTTPACPPVAAATNPSARSPRTIPHWCDRTPFAWRAERRPAARRCWFCPDRCSRFRAARRLWCVLDEMG